MGFSNLYSYEIGGVGGICFPAYSFSLLIFGCGYMRENWFFFPIGEFLGVVHTYSFSEGGRLKPPF